MKSLLGKIVKTDCLDLLRVDDLLSTIFTVTYVFKGDYQLKIKFWKLIIAILDKLHEKWGDVPRSTILSVIKLPAWQTLLSRPDYIGLNAPDETVRVSQEWTDNKNEEVNGRSRYRPEEYIFEIRNE